MATGADHYAQAQRLLDDAAQRHHDGTTYYAEADGQEPMLMAAQAHATLALAAAVEKHTRLTTGDDAGGYS